MTAAQRPLSAMPYATRRQIDALALDPRRPLVVTDADEVIVSFARPLESFLQRHGMVVSLRDYRLVGNVHHADTGQAVERETLFALIDDFFEAEVDRQPLVHGAADAIAALHDRAQVVVLTNLPETFLSRRIASFAANGVHAPVISNTGLKGASAQAMSDRVAAPLVFIDDVDQHIHSVADAVPHSYRIHYIADERLAAIAPPAPASHHRAQDWPDILSAIDRHLADHGY